MTDALEMSKTNGTKNVAVVVPFHKQTMDADEETSYRHLTQYLGRYDKFLVVPESLYVDFPGFTVKRFAEKYFSSAALNSALHLTEEFYESFATYEYILIYQLDALVFSDELLNWCARGFDYVGAPWFEEDGADFIRGAAVGNGGLSLRRVESFLNVTRAPAFGKEMERYRDAFVELLPAHQRIADMPRKAVRRIRSLARREQGGSGRPPVDPGARYNEDCFWSFRASRYDPGFKVAPVAQALEFAFEMNPQRCFERNGRRLPFGCHAWNKYDRAFWEPYLIK